MISLVIENGVASFRIGKHIFPVSAEECRVLGEALAMTGQLGAIINDNVPEWNLGTRWKLELASDFDDYRNRIVLHCDGKKWHMLQAELEKLGAAFTGAALELRH